MGSEKPIAQDSPTPNIGRESDVQANHPNPRIPRSASPSELPPSHAQYKIACQTKKDWWDNHKRWAELFGVLLLAVYTLYTIRMFYANRDAANAATSAAHTADATLKEIKQGGTDTHDLAVAAKQQADAAHASADLTGRQIELLGRVARFQYGFPIVSVATFWMNWLDIAEGRQTHVTLAIQNGGKRDAESLFCTGHVEFRTTDPRIDRNTFIHADFKSIQPSSLPPLPTPSNPRNYAYCTVFATQTISSEEYAGYIALKTRLYAWGAVRYEDFTHQGATIIPFCRYVSAKDVRSSAGEQRPGPGGYIGHYNECEQIPRSYSE
jgi:hypothetical protein